MRGDQQADPRALRRERGDRQDRLPPPRRGRSPAGIASATYVHGGRSKHLPNRLLERHREARTDPELLDLSADLATVEARIADVLGRVETGETGETWSALQAAWDGLRAAQRAKDPDRVRLAFARVEQTIAKGVGDWAAWRGVLDLVERRRLVGSKGRRRVQMRELVGVEDVLAVLRFAGSRSGAMSATGRRLPRSSATWRRSSTAGRPRSRRRGMSGPAPTPDPPTRRAPPCPRSSVMSLIASVAESDALYGAIPEAARLREVDRLIEPHQAFLAASPLAVLASVGEEGLDCSPKGDAPGFARVLDATTIAIPDRRGNNRIDNLRNIGRDPRVSLLFLIPGVSETLRVNGRATG